MEDRKFFCVDDLGPCEFDLDYYNRIKKWLINNDEGKYPISAVAKVITRNKYFKHARYYEYERQKYLHLNFESYLPEITWSDDYEYLYLHKHGRKGIKK